MNEAEGLERSIVLAGLDALRKSGGDTVVRALLLNAAAQEREDFPKTVAIVDYLRYRDAALEFLGDRFKDVAFETGRNLVRNFHHKKVNEIRRLIASFEGSKEKLPLVGQAAVLAAKGNPGVVRAQMRGKSLLLITIESCPECRGLSRETPFCFLNQGIITEFADRYLGLRVGTEETACIATGAPICEIHVTAG